MKCTLMNKNKEVLVAEYNEILKVFTDIYEVKNIDYAPLIIFNSYSKGKNITQYLLIGLREEEFLLGEMI